MTLAAHRGTALGTSMHVVVTAPDMLGAATHAVEDVVAAIDMACSRFRDDSELTRFQSAMGGTKASFAAARAGTRRRDSRGGAHRWRG